MYTEQLLDLVDWYNKLGFPTPPEIKDQIDELKGHGLATTLDSQERFQLAQDLISRQEKVGAPIPRWSSTEEI
jgi:hypothetical protein